MSELKKDAVYTIEMYSGYRGEETPRSLASGGQKWTIDHVLSRRRVIDLESGKQCDEFDCQIGREKIKIRIFSTGEKTLSFEA
jgi:hypothetical protein